MRAPLALLCLGLFACGHSTPTGEPGAGPDAGEGDAGGTADAGRVVTVDGGTVCAERPACDAPLVLGPTREFQHTESKLTVALGGPRHRGRDLFLRPGAPQWALAKFAYGATDKDLHDEEVDVFLLRDCVGPWIKVGTYRTSADGTNPTVEGVEDTGGRVYVNLAGQGPLGVGRHRVRMVVAGDLSTADLFLEVLPPNARIAVSDVDGTLTTSENAAFTEIFNGPAPDANPGSPEALHTLAQRGYYLFYLTARPDWFDPKTREWLSLRGFPRGILHTTLSFTGALGGAASDFKTRELAGLKTATALVPEVAFGNTETDLAAYTAAGIPPARSYYFKLETADAGVRQDDYAALVPTLSTLPMVCP